MTGSFQNLFDKQAKDYARYRPGYPRQLYELIAKNAPGHALAWDAGTGSGQAALSLAEYFDSVIATDSSQAQVEHARPHPQVTYRVVAAESSGLDDSSCDAVTVANAVHWFNVPAFFKEAERVLKPGGVVAVWCYTEVIAEKPMDEVTQKLKDDIRPYWPAPVRLVSDKYRNLEFPFEEIEAPEFMMDVHWTFDQILGYFSTWSAVQNYIADKGTDPVADLRKQFKSLAADSDRTYKVVFPLPLRIGRKRSTQR
jgi:ubiquinone/menaquinone biosynthesis C-methylase UbiE